MTDTIEQKALALVNKVRAGYGWPPHPTLSQHDCSRTEALCRAIEQHEAFRQEVSDAVEVSLRLTQGFEGTDAFKAKVILERFIIAKPDPLIEAMQEWWDADGYADIETFRAAIEKRGGKIVWGEG